MISIYNLRIGQKVKYNGIVCKVYSIIGPHPDSNERYNDKPVIELYDGIGLILALEDEISMFYED